MAPATRSDAVDQTGHYWRRVIAPHAEDVAEPLALAPDSRIEQLPKPLTSARRIRAGASGGPVRPASSRPPAVAYSPPARPKPMPSCKRCGEPVPRRSRVYCDACLPLYQREQFAEAFVGSGLRTIAQLKRAGVDPTHGGEAARLRGAATAQRKNEIVEWESRHGKLVDLSAFRENILPAIKAIPLSELQQATGLSLRYVSQIRRGERVPHPRHWQAFERAAGSRDHSIGRFVFVDTYHLEE